MKTTTQSTQKAHQIQPNFATFFEFQEAKSGKKFTVTLATLLQCLCIAEQQFIVPPFEPDWEAATIPPLLRSMSQIRG